MSETLRVADLASRLRDLQRPKGLWAAPLKFDPHCAKDRGNLEALLDSGQVSRVIDRLALIAKGLFELREPSERHDDVAEAAFVEEFAAHGETYGQWFFFPWSRELVRYPEREDHRALHTYRNRDLITVNEQLRLYEATIAVCGLSVGSNVVESLLRSGIGGTLILGDMDSIEPANLNRIVGTFLDVGVTKLDLVARRVSTTDPYIDQFHLSAGVTIEGLAQIHAERPIDLIIDEVDDLSIKAGIRQFGYDRRIPVLMATDVGDRSVIDIERYDQKRVHAFNGRLNKRDLGRLAAGPLKAEDSRRLTVKLVGLRSVTTRLIISAFRTGKTLAGLPQLGTTATLGGALVAVAARELLLGRKLQSGRCTCSPKRILHLSWPKAGRRSGAKGNR